ncbi:MAG: EAL domain-containing protein [Pseudomonadota bacterium]
MAAERLTLTTRNNIGRAQSLLQSLVPRAQVFCFYSLGGECIWSSDGADDYEVDSFIAEMPQSVFAEADATYLRRSLKSGRTLLILEARSGQTIALGYLVVVFSRNAGKSSWFNPSLLGQVLTPALDVISESLLVNDDLVKLTDQLAATEKELALVYEIDEKVHGASRSHAGLAQLVGQSGRHLSIAYSVLLIPSKRIRISATHSSWKNVNRKVMDRYLLEQILPKLEGRHSPVVFEIPAVEGSDSTEEQGYQTLVSPLLDKSGGVEGVLAQLGRVNSEPFNDRHRRFMSQVVRKVEYVIEQSFDAMTGLMNRAGFEAQLAESWNELKSGAPPHQLIYLDLDNLQLVNDTFGHSAGDAVIVRFVRLVEADLPKSAVLSRLTGDDFCILMTHADTEAALQLAQSIREKSQGLRYLEGDKTLQVTISVGIAECSKSRSDAGKALTSARMACEAAKDHGRDRVEVFDDADQSIIRRQDDMQLVVQIQQTLDDDGFDLLAQPVAALDAEAGRPRYEILLRMSDNDGELVPTKALFSAAERYNMMPQIDRWVISATVARLARARALVEGSKALFCINLSGQSLSDDEILGFVEQELKATGLSPACVGFEVTESAAVSNLVKAQNLIDALHAHGCNISLDDFGAGLSSFAYLKNFRVDTLKIDGSFIRDITDNRISESMVTAITQVAKVMGLQTVAEYVETEESMRLVKKIGVDFAQGHVVSKPIPLDDALAQLSVAEAG